MKLRRNFLEPLNNRIKNFAILSVHLDELVLLVIFEFLLPIKEALEPIIKIAADDECLLDHQLMSHLICYVWRIEVSDLAFAQLVEHS
jgi:hypothetical protein